jgi:hypothetical protein
MKHEKKIKKLKDKAQELSKGACPEPDINYWCGVAHALGYILNKCKDDLYFVQILKHELNLDHDNDNNEKINQ